MDHQKMSPKEFVWCMYVPVLYQIYLFPGHTSSLFWNICLNFTRTSCVLHLTAAVTRCSVLMKAAYTQDTVFNTVAAWWWYSTIWYGGPGYLSWCSDSLRAGWPGDGILVRARFSAPIQTSLGTHPTSYAMGTGSFPGVKLLVRELTTYPYLVLRLQK
jgi:hypothetical protein